MTRVCILGCRGIPNHHGGFDQLAEYLSVGLVEKGMDVTMYNSHNHPYQEQEWRGVAIKHIYDPEYKMGTFGQFIYDLNVINHIRKQDYDLILQLGYTSSTIWFWKLPKGVPVLTNMDGLEWKRRKYNWPVRQFLKIAEYLAIISSNGLISDSIGIQDYIQRRFKKESTYIAYGASLFNNPNKESLVPYNLEVEDYDMLIARMEPENNVEEIIQAKIASNCDKELLVVGNTEKTNYGKRIKAQYGKDPKIRFTEGIYDIDILNNLRFYSRLYIHGHSVGGTNPSLLEAMASNALLVVHDNPFNKAIIEEAGFAFDSISSLSSIFGADYQKIDYSTWLETNRVKVKNQYNWQKIIAEYYQLIQSTCENDG